MSFMHGYVSQSLLTLGIKQEHSTTRTELKNQVAANLTNFILLLSIKTRKHCVAWQHLYGKPHAQSILMETEFRLLQPLLVQAFRAKRIFHHTLEKDRCKLTVFQFPKTLHDCSWQDARTSFPINIHAHFYKIISHVPITRIKFMF